MRGSILRSAVFPLGLILSFLATPETSSAQAAQSLSLGPSVRASGTGRSSVAAFWGGDPDYWINPSLLAYQSKLRFEHGKTRLVPDLADGVYLKTDRFAYQRFGIGIGVSAFPLGRNRLDYGEISVVDSEGNTLGSFSSYETYRYFGVGVSFASLLKSVAEAKSPTQSWHSYGDVAIGFAHKRVHVNYAPAWATGDGFPGSGNAETNDLGLLVRFTPINSIGDGRSLVPVLDPVFAPFGGLRVDLSHGRSDQNFTDNYLEYTLYGDAPDVVFRVKNEGVGVYAAIGFPPSTAEELRSSRLAFLVESLSPLFSFGWSNQRITTVFPRIDGRINNSGWELTILNVFTLREGEIKDPEGHIRGSTTGWGLGFEHKELGGFRYDRAEVPQARGLDRVQRNSFTLFVDPFAVHDRWLSADR